MVIIEQLKSYIQHLPFVEQVSLAAWLAQLIQDEVHEKVESGKLAQEPTTEPPAWMWEAAE